jgi:hypothetical protein
MLPPHQQLAAPGKWPLVGEKAPAPWMPPWRVQIAGLVDSPRQWTLDELKSLPSVERVIDVHCVTRWSKPAMRFRGVPLTALLKLSLPRPEAKFISFIAHSLRDHSTSLTLADAVALDVLVAWEAEGTPLDEPHGGPLRTVVPGRYFYKSLKWLARIELLAEDRLGYWEATAGYHNVADPWREQRYIASNLSRREAAKILSTRAIAGQHLLSLSAAQLDLAGLDAQGALLRNADFRGSKLVRALFGGANLTNARFGGCDLREASLAGADCEGADFSAADLRGADFRGASLFGATFVTELGQARLDAATHFDAAALEMLAPAQAEFLRKHLALDDPQS